MTERGVLKKIFVETNKDFDGENTIKKDLIDLCIHLVFLLATTIIAMSSRDIGMYYFNHTIERLLLNRVTFSEYAAEFAFTDLVTVDDWWSFAETTFIEVISQFDVRGSNKSVISDNLLLGLPRLRQIRVRNESCRVHDIFRNEFKTCFGHYSKSKQDVSTFLNTKYSTQSELNTNYVWGLIAKYDGGGFIELLTFDKERNENIIASLKDLNWIDRATRLIIIEFTLFNANVNLFSNVKLLAEISATGGILTSTQIQSLKHSPLWNDDGYFILFCSLVILGLGFYYTLKVVQQLLSYGLLIYLGAVGNFLRVIIILIVYVSTAYLLWHMMYLKSILDRQGKEVIQYVSLDKICFWNLIFIDTMGITVFIVWIEMFKYIKFNKTMIQFSSTLQRCAKDLLGFTIMLLIVLIAYAYLAILWFGSNHSDFCDFPSAVLTLMRMVLGDFDYERLEAANRFLGPIFFLSFILFVFFILMNMFLAIINDTYSDVKSEITQGTEIHLELYIKSLLVKLKNYVNSFKKHQGDIEEQEVESRDLHQSRAPLQAKSPIQSNQTFEQKQQSMKEILDS